MPRKDKPQAPKWRNSRQLRGVRSQLASACKIYTDGATVVLDRKTAENLLEVCDQAIKTEVGHEPTKAEVKGTSP